MSGRAGKSTDCPSGPVTQNRTSSSTSGSGSDSGSLPKMQPDSEAPIMMRTRSPALVRMSHRCLLSQIILPYHRGSKVILTFFILIALHEFGLI